MSTPLPKWLQTMLDQAMAENDRQGYLPPEYRLAIYSRLEPMDSTPPNMKVIRGTLAIRAAEEVMPYWYDILPLFEEEPDDDQIPPKMLDMARDVVAGRANLPDAWAFANDQWYVAGNVVDEIFEYRDDVPNPIAYTAEAALKALLESMGAETLKPIYTLNDDHTGNFTDDAASAACVVVAGGGDTQVKVNQQVRYDFWTWWLRTAIPETWQQVGGE